MKKQTTTAITLALSSLIMSPVIAAQKVEQPNVVIIYVDDLGYGDLASYGHPIVKTPNIDQLAKEGIKYTQFYAPAPLCSPSRAGLLTGRTPYRTGIRSWIPPGQNVHLGENEITIAHLMKKNNYSTFIAGKVHLNGGIDMKHQPQTDDMGFDYSFIIPGGWVKNKQVEKKHKDKSLRDGKMYPDNFYRNGKPVGKTHKFSGQLVADETIKWLDNQKNDTPFFAYIPFSEVHTPIASPDKYRDMYNQYLTSEAKENPNLFHYDWAGRPYRGAGEYYANITFLDEQVGRIIRKLKQMEEYDDTIIIFSSDNGPVTREARKPWELNMAGETGGLRGRKTNLFEGGIRVPGIIRYPAKIKAGTISNEPVTALDILPTLAELTGYTVPSDRTIDGQSIVSTFNGQSIERSRPFIWTIDTPNQDDPINEWAIRDRDWKLILTRDQEPKFLFNIAKDPYEINNHVKNKPRILNDLMRKFQNYKIDIESDSLMLARKKKEK